MLKAIFSIYSLNFPSTLVYLLQSSEYKSVEYLKKFWHTQNFAKVERDSKFFETHLNQTLAVVLKTLIAVEVLCGLFLVYLGEWKNLAGGLAFGIALLIAYPVILAHVLPLVYNAVLKARWFSPKKVGKALLCNILETQVVSLRAKHNFKVIAIVGSVGKTSTKLAIAQALAVKKSVLYQEGNYNDRLTVPLVVFSKTLPNLFNIWAWARIIWANDKAIKSKFQYDCVLVELGTDRPGQIAEFKYLQPDITVVTAVAPEHMEFFGSLDAVAAGELAVLDFSKEVLVNVDDTPPEYLAGKNFKGYGFSEAADFQIYNLKPVGLQGSSMDLKFPKNKTLKAKIPLLGKQGAKISLAAASVAEQIGFKTSEIAEGIENIRPFTGRLQILEGLRDSTIIDDSYNASPTAVKAGLDVLCAAGAPQRIAVLGSMNELGEYSEQAHREVGQYCDKEKLNFVVTIGKDAKKYLAPAASEAGCKVESFKSPYEAGKFVKSKLKKGAVILVEGSQNGVFAEESIKTLLANPDDESKLVRQSKGWMEIKGEQFKA